MVEPDALLLLVSSTLLICYVSNLFYTKTKIPDIVWVLILGIILGPILGYFDKDLFVSLSPLMSTVALNIILFEAGLTVNIELLKEATIKSVILSTSTIFLSIITVGFALSTLTSNAFTLLEGMLVGSMVGGTSTIAVYAVLNGLDKLITDVESSRVILIMESVISDPICIITSLMFIKMIMTPGITIVNSLMEMLLIFVFSSGLGFIAGILWSEVLLKLKGRPLNYIMTIAILFPVYILAERAIGEGGGPVAALIFGLIISNYNVILDKFHIKKNGHLDQYLRKFHEEITFFIKSFFFVYMGIIITLSAEYILLGISVLVIILLARYLLVTVLGRVLKFSRTEKVLIRIVYASGLPAFVISQLPLILDPNRQYFMNPEIFPNLTMPLVLGNILFAAVAAPIIIQRQLEKK